MEIAYPVCAPSLVATLRSLTPARVGLERVGVSLTTRDFLAFQRGHAQARDAVYAELQPATLAGAVAEVAGSKELQLSSSAGDRTRYLQRPDLGRKLDEASSRLVKQHRGAFDLAVVLVDGLSALAVERHAIRVLEALMPRLEGWRIAPVCIVEQGRVAIGDEIGSALGAEIAVVLIGERPGLSSPDSLGAYITWQPQLGRTDAERNCISNIRPEGLSYAEAALQLAACVVAARRFRGTGVALKLEPVQLGEKASR